MSMGKAMSRALALSVILAAGAVAAQGAKPVRVGLVAPLTGGSGDFGTSARLGAELAVKEINEVGGVMGRPLELVIRDDRALPDEGFKAARDLVEVEKVNFTIGYCNTGVAMRAIEVFQKAGHLLMVPCSQGTAVTKKYDPAQSYIFRLAPSDAMNAKFLVHEMVDRKSLRKVAIFADRTGYGDGGVADIKAELKERGIEPLLVIRFDLGVQSLHEQMRAARDAGAEAVVVYAVGPEQAVAARSRYDISWRAPYFAPWPLSFRSVLEAAGAPALEGTLMAQTVIDDTSASRRMSFIAGYSALAKGREASVGSLMAAAQSYDAVQLMVRALLQTKGDASGPALKAALEKLERPYSGVVTTYEAPYSAKDHEAFSASMIWLGVWRAGKIKFFHAEDAQRASYVRRKNGSL